MCPIQYLRQASNEANLKFNNKNYLVTTIKNKTVKIIHARKNNTMKYRYQVQGEREMPFWIWLTWQQLQGIIERWPNYGI